MMLGQRSSSKEDKMIIGMVSSLVKIKEENVLKNDLEVEIRKVNVNLSDENQRN
jgi:hypothetical protein